jgi:hypothetical protein
LNRSDEILGFLLGEVAVDDNLATIDLLDCQEVDQEFPPG